MNMNPLVLSPDELVLVAAALRDARDSWENYAASCVKFTPKVSVMYQEDARGARTILKRIQDHWNEETQEMKTERVNAYVERQEYLARMEDKFGPVNDDSHLESLKDEGMEGL